jgi:oxygen-dependent protoporphyrinogen oxidase
MKIVILGGGISGLSAAWHVLKQNPNAHITLLEKQRDLGGAIQTYNLDACLSLLKLIDEMGLQNELLFSSPEAQERYLWHKGKLRPLRSFFPTIARALLHEALLAPSRFLEEESIYDFGIRRLTKTCAETLLDPMTLGIYAGDSKKLSLRSCFPFLFRLEQEKKSLLKAFFSMKKGGRLFTLQRGLSSLIDALEKKLQIEIVRNCPVDKIDLHGVYSKEKFWRADRIISALPGHVLGNLTGVWKDFPTQSLCVVHAAFREKLPFPKGFGYLIPTKEKESLLGMVWDSSIFPRSNASFPTVCTAMLKGEGDPLRAKQEVQWALERHLKIFKEPDWVESRFLLHALPSFTLGFSKTWSQVEAELMSLFPHLIVVGNYINGVSVDACVEKSFSISI